ncbi:formate dehydrogenase, alpha subunit [Dehalogenimonas lykanthroporepellens BL-DC-9]|nr:formate dehydrogenase, alpha subunit [Dehalogenimonas lykanthroporepellens BL-DC-9]
MIKMTIDGREVRTAEGRTVLEAAREAGIYVPSLCHHPDLKPYGGCRLCVVEIDGVRGLPTACTTAATEGLTIRSETTALTEARRTVMELLLQDHPLDCLACVKNQRCELQTAAAWLGVTERRLPPSTPTRPIDDSNPFFRLDRAYCILCARCTRACDEITGNGAIELTGRGYDSRVGTVADRPLAETDCRSCGECVARCPTAALTPKYYVKPDSETATICPYCGVGCGLRLQIRRGRITGVEGDSASPVSRGRLCVKGRFGIREFVHHPERLTSPLVRNRNGAWQTSSWDEALERTCSRLHGYRPEEIAVIGSAKATNEAAYLIQKLARAVIGTNTVDHCARLCHAPTVAGLAATFGSGAMSNSLDDLRTSACFLVIGANTTETHPVIGFDLRQAVKAGARLIVINPLRIPLARQADIFLQPRPGTDMLLLSAMAGVIIAENLTDRTFIEERTEGFAELAASLKSFDIDHAAGVTGVPADDIRAAARLYATAGPAAILYAMGITQHSHGTDNVGAIANLAMLTGNMGRPGSGVNPLRGHNNVQGACDMGVLPDVFPGYRRTADETARRDFEAAWETPLSSTPGLTLPGILDAIDAGLIKALYLAGDNLALSDADTGRVRRTLGRLELLIVQDVFPTETTELAHIVLPAASFAETDGTFTNTERRVQRVKRAVAPPGEARPDWWITAELGKRLGGRDFDYDSAEAVFEEIRAVVPAYAGINYRRLENGGLQWPCPAEDHPGTPILHTDRFTRGRGLFRVAACRLPAESPDGEYPFLLTTGRSPYHFHTGTMTRRVPGLLALQPEETLEIAADDARRLGIADGDIIRVVSRRGAVEARALLSRRTTAGVVFMTFHFPETATNILTSPAADPEAGTPEFKVAAVRLEKR